MALLVGLLAAPGCRESALGPDVPEDNVVVADGRHRGGDPYEVNSAAIDGHRLTIEVSYSGGCRRHDFTLVISKSFRESDLVQLPAALAHDANGDTCEAYPTESRVFEPRSGQEPLPAVLRTRSGQGRAANRGRAR